MAKGKGPGTMRSDQVTRRRRAKPAKPISGVKPRSARPVNKPDDTRQAILRAALDCFSNAGFEATSIADVARAANVGHPLVHYYFGSKERLWHDAVESSFGDLLRTYDAINFAINDLSPIDALRVMLRAFAKFCAENPHHVNLLLTESKNDSPRLSLLLSNYLSPLHKRADELVLKAIAAKQIRALDPVHLTNMMIGSIMQFSAANVLIKSLYQVDSSSPVIVSRHADVVMDVILNGIAIRP
ncbi:MAG: CerR family C-terminal domain-containing protein [Brevundimonas sp.]